MANTFEEFKNHMDWSTLELPYEVLKNIYESVDTECYSEMGGIEEDFSLEDNLVFYDVNLHSVVENYSEVIERGLLNFITFYHLSDDDMYVGVLEYTHF